jgi:hypothetical protein
MEDRGWRVILPKMRDWSTDVDKLKLDVLYNGIRPA